MKRELKADRPAPVKAASSPKAQEREFAELADVMIERISRQFRNQALLALNKGDVAKFSDCEAVIVRDGVTLAEQLSALAEGDAVLGFTDAKPGNFATVFLRLANKVRRKLLRTFDDDRIEEIVAGQLAKVDKRNQQELYQRIERRLGLSTKELTATEGLRANINALTLESAQWIKRLRDETLELYTARSLQAMALGGTLEDILAQYDGMVEQRRNHAKFTAHNQITNFNSMATKIRAQNLGITRARWATSHDERVRESHKDRDGREFDIAEGCYSHKDRKHLLPGVDYQCRCDYELIIPEE